MITVLNEAVSLHSLIWLFLVAFMLHDFEEIIRIEPWFRKHYDSIRERVPERFHKDLHSFATMGSSQFAVAVCIEFVTFVPVTFIAAEYGHYTLFLGFNLILLLHVFMHIGQALFVRKLVPGVVTAVFITLPYSVYLLYRFVHEDLVTATEILIAAPFGLLLIPILLLGHKAGEKFGQLK